MSEFLVIGGGGHARVLIHTLKTLRHDIRGYTALADEGKLMQIPYLGTDDVLASLRMMVPIYAVLGVGKTEIQSARLALFETIQSLGIRFPPIVGSGALCHAGVYLGDGTVVFDGAVVVVGSRLGRACIVNTNATVDHDCVLGDDVHIAPGATLSGGVEVGDHCMIGTGANLIHSVRVCADCMIGAGATVVRDITTPGLYVGTPARRIA